MSAKDDHKYAALNTLYKIKALGEMLNESAGHKLDISDGALTSIGLMVMELAQEAITELDRPASERVAA